MAAKKLKLTHPGEILREEFMEPVGISAYALAKALDVPLPTALSPTLYGRIGDEGFGILLIIQVVVSLALGYRGFWH